MTTTTTISSPTPSLSSPNSISSSQNLSDHLDSQIARLNAQIASLRQEKSNLSSALLASSTVQNIVQSRKSGRSSNGRLEEDGTYRRLEEAVTKQQARNDITVHRLMNNVTSFPFTDPAPDMSRDGEGAMLGLRFEVPFIPPSDSRIPSGQNNGTTTKTVAETERTFLVVLRLTQHNGKTYLNFQPEMNQIPKHIDVEGFAGQYLPVPDTEMGQDTRCSPSALESENFQDDSGIDVTQDMTNIINGNGLNGHPTTVHNSTQGQTIPTISVTGTNQSLPLFVSTTRDALLSWHYRKSYIQQLIDSLTLPSSSPAPASPAYAHFIANIQPDPPAVKLTIDWENGATGVLGINEDGYVNIARVFGPRIGMDDEQVEVIDQEDGNGTFRCHGVERRLEGVWLGGLEQRLEEVGRLTSGSA